MGGTLNDSEARSAMDITIDRLNLQLPAGFEHRADAIARRFSQELGNLAWSGNMSSGVAVDRLSIPAQTVHPAWSDQQIARQLAVAVHGQIVRTNK